MDELNFDKILKQRMAEERDFPYSDEKWDKMEKQIDNFKAEKRQRRLLWTLALPFLGLLGLLLFMAGQLNETQRTLQDLTKEIQHLRSEKPLLLSNLDSFQRKTILKSDTVYHHIIVRRYDTIFQAVVQRTLSEVLPNKDNFKLNSPNNSVLGKEKVDIKTPTQTLTTVSIQPNSIIENKEIQGNKQNDIILLGNKETIIKKADTSQTALPLSILGKDSIKLPPVITSKENISEKIDTTIAAPPLSISTEKTQKTTEKRKWLPILKPIKLSGYEIGFLGGTAFIGNDDVVRQTGYVMGARGTIGLGERFKIVGDAQYLALSYDVDKLTRQHDIPTINPPTINDELKEIKIEKSAFHFGLGLQYDLTRSRLRPFVGVGAIGELKLEEIFDFQFKNKLTKEDISVRTKRHEDDFNLPYLRLNAGFAYPVFNKLNVQLEGSYDVPFDNKRAVQPLWQVKGAVFYRF
jgi:hypothetical protein